MACGDFFFSMKGQERRNHMNVLVRGLEGNAGGLLFWLVTLFLVLFVLAVSGTA